MFSIIDIGMLIIQPTINATLSIVFEEKQKAFDDDFEQETKMVLEKFENLETKNSYFHTSFQKTVKNR